MSATLDFLPSFGISDEKLFSDLLDVALKPEEYLSLTSDVDIFGEDLLNSDECIAIKNELDSDNSEDANMVQLLTEDRDNDEILIDSSPIDNVVEVDSGADDLLDCEEGVVSNIVLDDCESPTLDDEALQFTNPNSVEIHHNYCSLKYASSSGSETSSPNSRKQNHTRSSRSKAITDIVLTDEEIRLLSKEGYQNFPTGNTPLTKQEERVLRKIRRKIRNKKSAQCSRQRKKEYLDELEKKFEKCSSDNHILRKENLRLKKANESLMIKLKRLLILSGVSNGQTSFKTSFFVLILSFMFIVFPFFRYAMFFNFSTCHFGLLVLA
ncbi:cyclic AMP-responsive element-binding protein 3-like protein 3 [Leptotrombidium deliense]|uniref:Cyclic AMP-responsive element-binding protein 3-like protein 3 n=1 Tax=Leptotrombidium deliense TaxID=299467 RepID=A0A443SC71_9ACAR|nr:cyclic AMP-responsive element-binding protein 3-like protein 3 [Leptotrombidium deliense]